jgi:hypothetical protein
MNDLQSIVNKFLDSTDILEDEVLKAIIHVLEVELRERDFMSNPQNFGGGDEIH